MVDVYILVKRRKEQLKVKRSLRGKKRRKAKRPRSQKMLQLPPRQNRFSFNFYVFHVGVKDLF